MIILIFVPRRGASGLAHVPCHCVTGISLPPVDANILFIVDSARQNCKEEHLDVKCDSYLSQRVLK